MDTIRWDAMAALVAMIGLPLMLSGSATWLIKTIIHRTQRFLLAHGSTCERLEWQDIPDGPLGELPRSYPTPHSNHPYSRMIHLFEHNDQECFASSIGKVFQYAWASARRRDKRVFKPYQLGSAKHYVRTDRKTLEAFLLLSHTSMIQFHDSNGILTAHLPVIDSSSRSGGGELHIRTKHEVEMILQGYPPFYLERIKVTDRMIVSSPISTMADIKRGGWILGVGLDSLMTPQLSTHNLSNGYLPPSTWIGENWSREKNEWMSTCIPRAINRFGEVLNKLLVLFPGENAAKGALDIYQSLIGGPRVEGVKTMQSEGLLARTRSLSPFDFLAEYREFAELEGYAAAQALHQPHWVMQPLSCRSKLNKDEWQLAMSAFNHSGPLEQHEIELFTNKLLPILQAGVVGLLCVLPAIDPDGYLDSEYRKLPSNPQLLERKYVYLSQCEPAQED